MLRNNGEDVEMANEAQEEESIRPDVATDLLLSRPRCLIHLSSPLRIPHYDAITPAVRYDPDLMTVLDFGLAKQHQQLCARTLVH